MLKAVCGAIALLGALVVGLTSAHGAGAPVRYYLALGDQLFAKLRERLPGVMAAAFSRALGRLR